MASIELRFTTYHFISEDIRKHKYKNKIEVWVTDSKISKRPLTAVPSGGVNEKEMMLAPQLPTQTRDLSAINILDIQSSQSSLRTEAGVKLQEIVDSSINVPVFRSRRSSSESTRVQEWNNDQGNVDCVCMLKPAQLGDRQTTFSHESYIQIFANDESSTTKLCSDYR